MPNTKSAIRRTKRTQQQALVNRIRKSKYKSANKKMSIYLETGKNGNFQQFFHVYGEEKKNCSRISCKGKIKKIKISNRSSFYCNKCQN